MKHCRAFFDALDDWIRRHHSVSLEPSGLFTAVWCLLQAANILEFTEADWKAYLLLPGEDNHFTVNHVKKVKNKADLLEKLRKQEVSILGDNLDDAISKLVTSKGQELPLFARKVNCSPSPLEEYWQALEARKAEVDFTAIRLTPIRNDNVYIPKFQPVGSGHVSTNGSEAETLVLFPHESSATEITSPSTTIQLVDNSYDSWGRRWAIGLDHCIFGIVSIVDNQFEMKETELNEYRHTLARLLEHLAKMISEQSDGRFKDALEEFQRAVKLKDESWLTMQDCAQAFLNKQPTTRHPSGIERLVFLRPSDQRTRKHFIYPKKKLAGAFLKYSDKIQNFFTVRPTYKPSPERLCPECRDSGKPPFEYKNQDSLAAHRRKKHGWSASVGEMWQKSQGNNNSKNEELATKRTKQQTVRTPKKTLKVQQDDLVSSGPDLSRIHTSEEDALNEHKRVQVSDDGTRYDHPSADICGQDVTNSFEESADVTPQMESTFYDTNYAIPDPGSELYGNELVNELGDTNLFSALQ